MERTTLIPAETLVRQSEPFLRWLADWRNGLTRVSLSAFLNEPGFSPAATAVLAVDVIRGFCEAGPLASARVGSIVPPIVRLFARAHAEGVTHFILPQDTHRPDAEEFAVWPPHCMAGTVESETVPQLKELPFADQFTVLPKNCINSGIGTGLPRYLDERPQLTTFIVTGDCTDLCVYQLAMYLRLRSHAAGLGYRVVIPADCVETYDLPVERALEIGAMPHDGDLLHHVFLYHMALNGVQVVAGFD